MPFLITRAIDGDSTKDAIINLDLCFGFVRDSDGHTVAVASNGARIIIEMSFTELQEMATELNTMELGEPEIKP